MGVRLAAQKIALLKFLPAQRAETNASANSLQSQDVCLYVDKDVINDGILRGKKFALWSVWEALSKGPLLWRGDRILSILLSSG